MQNEYGVCRVLSALWSVKMVIIVRCVQCEDGIYRVLSALRSMETVSSGHCQLCVLNTAKIPLAGNGRVEA